MFSRVRLASVAVCLLLSSVAVGHAQVADTTHAGRQQSYARPGRGSLGFQSGMSWFAADGDYTEGALPRLTFAGSYRYFVSDKWAWQVSPYFTWNAYGRSTKLPFTDPNFPADVSKGDVLVQLVGANAQWQRAWGGPHWRWHVGAGPAAYRVVIQNHRKVLKDPTSKRLHQGTYLAGAVELGAEHFNTSLPNTSLEWTVASHMAFATRDDQFVEGFNGNPLNIEGRFGIHYFFDFNRAKRPERPAAGSAPTPTPGH